MVMAEVEVEDLRVKHIMQSLGRHNKESGLYSKRNIVIEGFQAGKSPDFFKVFF